MGGANAPSCFSERRNEMVYVYCRKLSSGAEEFCGVYDTWEEALARITHLYNIDKNGIFNGQYYYFAKEH